MGWELPRFGHLPMIHGPDGAKLSKRHGAQGVREFADLGYLAEAMRNYLARLGWGHGDDEIFSDAQATEWFDIVNVVAAPARLDWPKLNHINQHYIREADNDRLQAMVVEILRSREVHLPADFETRLARTIPLVKEGAKTTLELADLTLFALKPRPIQLADKAKALLTEEVQARLRRLTGRLAVEPDWSSPPLHVALKTFADQEGGFGKFGPALRPILAAGAVAPDLASALAALGQDESLGRIEDALSQVQ
jgi:glutamyl-tRNA synthetase